MMAVLNVNKLGMLKANVPICGTWPTILPRTN